MKTGFYNIISGVIGWQCYFPVLRQFIRISIRKYYSVLIIAFTIIIVSVLNVSCKTCKCPAYSQSEYKIHENSGVLKI